ncbi:MAG: hypothetical protein CL678_04135 [Bdellovibrionaceae bacterium]|nr:hypothetical protein [Pseudobdellovibrionaceae bacterium]
MTQDPSSRYFPPMKTLLFTICSVFLASCGIKAPPLAPLREPPTPIEKKKNETNTKKTKAQSSSISE